MKRTYSIKEVAEIFNITTNKIRFYEKKGLISPRKDEENGYRIFVENDFIKLQTILMYRELDLPIETINDIFQDTSKNNILDHFYVQWDAVNKEIHKMNLIRESLEKIMDNVYSNSSDDYQENIVKEIEMMHQLWKRKNEWEDRWDFDNWAKTYDNAIRKKLGSLDFYKNYDELLETIFTMATKNRAKAIKTLEIGVGTGNLAEYFLEDNYDIIGIDQSRQMLNQSKLKFPKLKLRLGEFLNIPYENNKFDTVVSTYAFHHLDEEEKKIAIAEMIRVTKAGGKILIGDLMFESEKEKQKKISTATEGEIEEIEDEYFANVDELKEEFEKQGKKVEITRIDELIFILEAN